MKYFTCIICGNRVNRALGTRSSRNDGHNAIFLASLRVFTCIPQELINHCFAEFKRTQKFVCPLHFINAAQYLVAEVALSGGKFTERTAGSYLMDAEISDSLIDILNNAIRAFTENITVSRSDIASYINFYVTRYLEGSRWVIPGVFNPPKEEEEELPEMEQEIVAEHNAMEVDVDMENLAEAITQEERKAPVPQRGDTGSSFKSTVTTDTSVSHFSPRTVASEDDEDDADNIQRLAPTKPELMDKYFLVQGKKLLELFRLSRCGCPNDDEPGTVQLEEEGSAPIITYLTKGDRLRKRRWSGQEKIGSRPNDKRLTGNAKICVAAATTGLRITRLLKWAEETNVALPSRSAFYDVFKALRPSIAQVYERHQNDVIQIIRNAYEREEQLHGWDIAVDGAFDSRGFSADFCKVLAVDLKTNLCIYTELVHRSETAGVSGRMEKEGFHRLLRWFRSRSIEINSISTDRSTVYGTEIRQFNAEFNTDIKWFLDPWHLARNLYKKLRTAAKRTGCEDLRQWIDPLKAHLYDAVRKGAAAKNGDLIRQTFNSCLFHVADIHEWVEDATTGPVTKCGHKPLTGQRDKPALPTGSIPHDTLKAIVLNPVFQKDLTMTSHLGGTRQCEAKNSLDRLYCPKELFLPASTYNFYVKLSTLHKNALTLAEMRGERTVKREFDVTRKFNDRESHMVEKTAIEHVWRREIYVHYTTNNYPQPETEEALNER